MTERPVSVFQPTFGRWLCGGLWLVSAIALVLSAVAIGWRAVVVLPWLLLLSGAAWAAFWNPRVSVDDGGVHLVNVTRTVDLPWPAITAVDTKWALTLHSPYGKFTAWAAPAPGGLASARMSMRAARSLPGSTYGPDRTIRPGDHPESASGAAALVVRHRWEELREKGFLDTPRLEHPKAPVRWHWTFLLVAAVLVALGALALLI